jgi:peptide/nickel transport system substrate-binding protein
LNRHVFGAWEKLGSVRWVFAAWIFIALVSLWGVTSQILSLSGSKAAEKPVKGGVYMEALLGQVKSVNPLFPENSATEDISSLVYSGLTKLNGEREVVADLSDKWDISADKKTYTFHIRDNAKWHDGVKLTAQDVAFTIDKVQNPDTRSPYAPNWGGVKYEVVNDNTIRLSLPSPYGNFLANTTLGILPKHKLESVKASSLRSYEFNQRPVGSGPYKLELLEVDSNLVNLESFDDYYIHQPYIKNITFSLFQSNKEMIDALVRRQVDAVSQVLPEDVPTVEKIQGVNDNRIGLPAYVGAFFNLKSQPMSNIDFRQALTYSVDKKAIVNDSLKEEAAVANFPILAGFVGFNPDAIKYEYNLDKAKQSFEKSKIGSLNLRLVTLDSPVYKSVANKLAEDWKKLGINVEVITADNTQLQQNYIRSRNYDILLYGQSIGTDSDVYSFWHSSQASDPGLNLSSYKNADADKLLEAGRLAKDQSYKATRYAAFIDLWAKDLPAVILYSPYYNYAQSDIVKGFDAKKIAEPSNRFYNVYDWYISKK